jgi:tRNA-2-methylthio-N6-dimethylallyladenosine synthase
MAPRGATDGSQRRGPRIARMIPHLTGRYNPPAMKYHVWTEGCQMNVADSQRVASSLERLGYAAVEHAEEADVIVLNTCVVRQSAEDRAYGRLTSLRPLKESRPDLVINLMGCLVGVKGDGSLRQAFPYVDVFSPPSDPTPLVDHLLRRDGRRLDDLEVTERFATMDGDLVLPLEERGRLVAAHVPVVYGCSHACTFCIIPYRRGPERSRSMGEIAVEVRSLVQQGVRQVTLLGQIVDRYGADVPDGPDLSALLRHLHDIDGLERLRFLTSHPNWMTDRLLDTVAELPKVCEHIEVPVQAGDDGVLERMHRGYRADDYRRLVERIRCRLPQVSIATDIIVGFPGESERQFQATYDLLAELRLDVAHVARYSARPGTVANRRMDDDVPEAEKDRRFRALEDLQTVVAAEINARLVGETVEVLVETRHAAASAGNPKGGLRGVGHRWKGRSRTNKLVFLDSDEDLRGRRVSVRVEWAGPWSLVGIPTAAGARHAVSIEARLTAPALRL